MTTLSELKVHQILSELAGSIRAFYKVSKRPIRQKYNTTIEYPAIISGNYADFPLKERLGEVEDNRYGDSKNWLEWRHNNGDDCLENILGVALNFGGAIFIKNLLKYRTGINGFTDEELNKLKKIVDEEVENRKSGFIHETIFSRHSEAREIVVDMAKRTATISFESIMCRYGFGENNELIMFDPDGGPYIRVGMSLQSIESSLPNYKIHKINKITEVSYDGGKTEFEFQVEFA